MEIDIREHAKLSPEMQNITLTFSKFKFYFSAAPQSII